MSQQVVMKSFFDEIIPQESFWEKQQIQIDNTKIEYQGLLFTKSRKTGFWVSRNYLIYESKLVKLKPNSKLCHFVNLNMSRIEKIKYKNDTEKESCNKKKYGFRVMRNEKYKELYSRSKELNQKLWDQLKIQALLVTFKEDYTIQKMIGKGNFAKVYLCTKKSDKQLYAVKVFEKCKMTNAEVDKQALLKEIVIMRKLNYKGLIRMHEVYEDDTHIFLVQDYLEGGELQHHIKKNQRLPENVVAQIISTLLDSLDYLHKKNILHRDLKPENMILRRKGILYDIVIADFGLADFYDPLGHYMFQRCGTPGFVAPEVLQDKIYDSKVDIFSVGCLMYLLLAGKSPFKGTTYDEVVMRNYHCKVDYQFIEPIVSQACISLLKLLLHSKPQHRPNPRDALKHEWFMNNLKEDRYKELCKVDEFLDTKDTKSSVTDTGSCGFMKHFIAPATCEKPEYLTPQVGQAKRDQNLYTPQQLSLMQEIQEQMNDSDRHLSIKHNEDDDDFTDMMLDEESPQSHKLPQYQLFGKLKSVVDSQTSSYYASPLIKNTPESQYKEIAPQSMIIQQRTQETPVHQPRIANKVMNNLRNLEQL